MTTHATPVAAQPSSPGMHDVFICYRRESLEHAVAIARRLSDKGLSVFFDRHLEPGTVFRAALHAQVSRARSFVVLVAPDGLTDWQKDELGWAVGPDINRLLFPVALPGRSAADCGAIVSGGIGSLQWVDCQGPPASDPSIDRLAAAILRKLGRGAFTPPPPARPPPLPDPPDDLAGLEVPPGGALLGCLAGEPDERQRPFTMPHRLWAMTNPLTRLQHARYGRGHAGLLRDAERLPAGGLSFRDAIELCNALSSAAGFAPAYRLDEGFVTWNDGYAAAGYRLPTEAEWERLALGGGRAQQYGPIDEIAVHAGVARGPRAVGGRPPNGFRLHDMLGNVQEWTWDLHGDDGVRVTAPAKQRPLAGIGVVRGGSWLSDPENCRASRRFRQISEFRLETIGCRVVRTLRDPA